MNVIDIARIRLVLHCTINGFGSHNQGASPVTLPHTQYFANVRLFRHITGVFNPDPERPWKLSYQWHWAPDFVCSTWLSLSQKVRKLKKLRQNIVINRHAELTFKNYQMTRNVSLCQSVVLLWNCQVRNTLSLVAVSILTQSFALRALRTRRPQETQFHATNASASQ